jgi:hypothetical protein
VVLVSFPKTPEAACGSGFKNYWCWPWWFMVSLADMDAAFLDALEPGLATEVAAAVGEQPVGPHLHCCLDMLRQGKPQWLSTKDNNG